MTTRCCRFVDESDERIQLRIESLDPLEIKGRELCGRYLACPDARRQFERGRERELVAHRLRPVSHFHAVRWYHVELSGMICSSVGSV